MPRIALHTFGCKINQYESQGMGEALVRAGHTLALEDEGADVHLINSCTVTESSDAQCRLLIRRVTRANPGARIVVTGCYAEREPEAVAALPGVTRVVAHAEKGRIAEHVAAALRGAQAQERDGVAARRIGAGAISARKGAAFDETPVTFFARRTRATLKVQDGCDKQCGFCIIPQVRGASRSRSAEQVVAEAERFIAAGYLEIVLAGIHLGSWRDPSGNGRLEDLVECLLQLPGLARLRISSLEPQHLTERLLALTDSPRLLPFFHLPLQSGDEGVLRRMRRGYTAALYSARVEALAARAPETGIGADIIVGYPGEDDAAFERGYRFVDALPLSHLHVFSFSSRPGTHAATLEGAVSRDAIRERSARMHELAERKAAAFRARFSGSRAQVLVERKRTRAGRLTGLTENYIRVEMLGRGDLANRIVTATLRDEDGAMLAIPEAA
ncbi:MAG: tRNA (N(6)-L-threonylcarbamoyladenosine(37)-C(2))-methylthiotransferase MtaB [bacterium]